MITTNKIALVTGGSRGLGKDMAIKLAQKGIAVVLTYHSKQQEADAVVAEITQAGGKAAALQLNVGEVNPFDTFVEQLKATLKEKFDTDRFDFLINNAGVGLGGSFADTTEEQFDLLMNVHFKGVFFLTQKLLTLINDGGRIINLSSGLTRFTSPQLVAYACMKGAIEVLTNYLAKELGVRGIAVNTVAPGAIETDFGGGLVRDNLNMNKHIAGLTALGRVGRPDDIGSVVAFLCTEDAKWVNAQRLEVSGGVNI
ncbi:SDR family oxidoreductase [Pedobacter sp.]|uniref:SDR family oxidoreductase n=1 Tax=Pedobacter sp. TaxID=1411316 RepID=UPI003D7F863E